MGVQANLRTCEEKGLFPQLSWIFPVLFAPSGKGRKRPISRLKRGPMCYTPICSSPRFEFNRSDGDKPLFFVKPQQNLFLSDSSFCGRKGELISGDNSSWKEDFGSSLRGKFCIKKCLGFFWFGVCPLVLQKLVLCVPVLCGRWAASPSKCPRGSCSRC